MRWRGLCKSLSLSFSRGKSGEVSCVGAWFAWSVRGADGRWLDLVAALLVAGVFGSVGVGRGWLVVCRFDAWCCFAAARSRSFRLVVSLIDWLTVRLVCAFEVRAGQVLSLSSDGEVEWRAEKRLQVEGSFSSVVSVRRSVFDDRVEISGNPAKWFQGHNVFGVGDLELVPAFCASVLLAAGYSLSADELGALFLGDVVVSRIDVTESWDFGNEKRALSAIQALGQTGTFRHRGRGTMLDEGTVYWRQRSRRISSKAYAKGPELRKHPATCGRVDELGELAAGLVRFEFCLRAMWLKARGLDVLSGWVTLRESPANVHRSLMAGLNVGDATMRDPTLIGDLAPRLQATYQLWLEGHDLRAMFPKATFYRYRAQLLKHGVDIGVKRPRDVSNVVRLVPILEGRPFQVPERFVGTPLYFEPRKVA